MAALIKIEGLPVMWDSFLHLDAAVRTGRSGTTFVDPAGFFASDDHPDESDDYDRGMTAMTVRRIARPRFPGSTSRHSGSSLT